MPGCIIFSLFAASLPAINLDAAVVSTVWSYIGELVFNITEKGRKYFNEVMSTYASESNPPLFEFNAVIINLNKVSKNEALKLISK